MVCDVLLGSCRRMFTQGSSYLYTATRNKLFFRNVTIIIPSHWTSKPEYGPLGENRFDLADVIVAPANPLWAPDPYTLQIQGCGKPGSFIHFMDEYLTDPEVENTYGNLGRVLVHEWGHFRWGLFNEYPDPVGDRENVAYFYQSTLHNNEWRAVT
ncbi:calcium-activated chloride channel regulator family member 3-like [Diadema antillarum]|uniref:calcium-activated chloride channel regulator family member 3-like n=1 Tax=Diadema antillarum TaxID=105358 RepID=UPI003A868B9E